MPTKNYSVIGKTVLPVHVGGGSEYNLDPLEYTVKNGWFYRLDMGHLFREKPQFARDFVTLSEREYSITRLRDLINDSFDPALRNCWLFRSKASPEFEREFHEKMSDSQNQLLVQCMMHSRNSPIIPGSSIKGAVRTAVLDGRAGPDRQSEMAPHLYQKDFNTGGVRKDFKTGKPKLDRKAVQNVEGKILTGGRLPISTDPFRALKISDAILPEDATEIVQVLNTSGDNSGKGIPMWVEVVRREIDFSFDVSILGEEQQKQVKGVLISKSEIVEACNNFFQEAIYYEDSKFYTRMKDTTATDLVEDIERIVQEKNEDMDFTIIRVGRFSHLESMTFSGDLRMPDSMHKKGRGKTRNLINGKIPLGIVSCQFIKE